MKKLSGELELIDRIRSGWGNRPPSPRGLALGIGDDCAILRPPCGHELLVTTDFTLEGRHFRRDSHPAHSVGHRTLARGLSDLAAMGARPLAAFLSLALPAEMLASRAGRRWVEEFFTGLRHLAQEHRLPLAGGDTAESPCGLVLADIVLLGSAPRGRSLRRGDAKAGDCLYVTGELGGAAAQLSQLKPGKRNSARFLPAGPQLYPQPRIQVGLELLRRRLATAAIDLSDGLSTDLAHLCRESGVGAEIDEDALPIHALAKATGRGLHLALNGGEDYELLFAASSATRVPRSISGVRVTRIGRLVRGKSVLLLNASGRRPLPAGGWEHFARSSK